jgi:hypothetical protein
MPGVEQSGGRRPATVHLPVPGKGAVSFRFSTSDESLPAGILLIRFWVTGIKTPEAMKPYVICHMLGSVDGRIKQDIWGFKDHHKYFEETAEKIPADAWLVGRVTMQEFSSKNPLSS